MEVDAATWHSGRLHRSGFDWSAQPSGHALDDVRLQAVELARRYLRQRGDASAVEMAEASPSDLIRRLNLVDGEGRITNAGGLLFVATPDIGIDYIRRDVPGGDSRIRIRGSGSLLEQLYETELACESANPTFHVAHGLAHGEIRVIPSRALREAIVNGVFRVSGNLPIASATSRDAGSAIAVSDSAHSRGRPS